MTIVRVGTNQKYSDGWVSAFSRKKTAKPAAAKAGAKKSSAKKASPKKSGKKSKKK